jgi:hypothetical protein
MKVPKLPAGVQSFKTQAEFDRFVEAVIACYQELDRLAAMAEAAVGGGEAGRAVRRELVKTVAEVRKEAEAQLLARPDVTPAKLAQLDRETEALWPIFKAIVDRDLTTSRKLTETLLAAQQGKPH